MTNALKEDFINTKNKSLYLIHKRQRHNIWLNIGLSYMAIWLADRIKLPGGYI